MCERIPEGYRLTTNRIVRYKYWDKDLAKCSPEEYKEIYNEVISPLEFIPLKNDVQKILIGIEEIKLAHKKTQQEMRSHTLDCPIKKDVVNDMIQKKIDLHEKKYYEGEKVEKLNKRIKEVSWEGLKEKIFTANKLVKIILGFLFGTGITGAMMVFIQHLLNGG